MITVNGYNKELETEPRKSKHARTIKDYDFDFYAFTLEDPQTLKEALTSLDADFFAISN